MRTLGLDRAALKAGGLWILTAMAMAGAAGCENNAQPTAVAPSPAAVLPPAGMPAGDQQLFASDDEAAKFLLEVAKAKDQKAIDRAFGPVSQDLLSGDPVEDARGLDRFAEHMAEQMRLEKKTDSLSILHVGKKDWPFPIPLVKNAGGKWFFDAASGKEEILARRIGHNELETIKTCRAYVLAQRQYASADRDGSGVLKYAQHYRSTPGKKDGLYWEAAPGEEQSPAGPMVAAAAVKGYSAEKPAGPRPFQGYYFHILKSQGPAAPGGKYDYVINGNMIAGFAMLAWPDKYGSSGVMTFIISHNGKLYQKDLGPDTDRLAGQMTEYNPDSTWTLVKD